MLHNGVKVRIILGAQILPFFTPNCQPPKRLFRLLSLISKPIHIQYKGFRTTHSNVPHGTFRQISARFPEDFISAGRPVQERSLWPIHPNTETEKVSKIIRWIKGGIRISGCPSKGGGLAPGVGCPRQACFRQPGQRRRRHPAIVVRRLVRRVTAWDCQSDTTTGGTQVACGRGQKRVNVDPQCLWGDPDLRSEDNRCCAIDGPQFARRPGHPAFGGGGGGENKPRCRVFFCSATRRTGGNGLDESRLSCSSSFELAAARRSIFAGSVSVSSMPSMRVSCLRTRASLLTLKALLFPSVVVTESGSTGSGFGAV